MQKKAKKMAQKQEQRWRKPALGRSSVAQSKEFVSKRKGKMAIIRSDDIDLGDSEDDSELEALIDYMQNTSTVDDAGNYDLAANEQLLKSLRALNLPQGDNVDLEDEESELSSNSENDEESELSSGSEKGEESEWSSNSDKDWEISDDYDDEDEEYDLKYFAGHFGWDDEMWLPEQAEGAANAKVQRERNEQFQRILNGTFDEVPPSLQAGEPTSFVQSPLLFDSIDFGKYPVLGQAFNNFILSSGFKARLQRMQKKGKLTTNTTGYSSEVNRSALSRHDARSRNNLEKRRKKAEKKNTRKEKNKMIKGKSQSKKSIDLRKTDR